MLDICITASSPSLAPRARARRQASARSFRGRERGRWTAPLSNSAAGVSADYAARAAHSCAAGSGKWLQRAPALPLGRFSGFRVQMKGNVEPRRCAARRLFPKTRTLILRCSSFKHCE